MLATGSVKNSKKKAVKYIIKKTSVAEYMNTSHILVAFMNMNDVRYLKILCEEGPQLSLQQMPEEVIITRTVSSH